MNTPALGGLLSGQENATIICRNDEESLTIRKGDTVCFQMDGTRDGKDVILPVTGTITKAHSLLAGVALEEAAPGEKVRLAVRGVVQTLNVMLMTRAASTDGFASYPAIVFGDVLTIDTVGNLPRRSAAAAGTIYPAAMVAMQTVASFTTSASTTSNTSLVSSTTIKAFLRIF